MYCLYRFANRIFYLATKTAGKNFGPNKRAYKIKQISERYFEPCKHVFFSQVVIKLCCRSHMSKVLTELCVFAAVKFILENSTRMKGYGR